MESEDLLRYYLDEVKDTHNDINILVLDEDIPNEADQATDFLVKAGLSNLKQLYQQGKEISEKVIADSVREKHLNEKQAQTVKSRIATLNKTLRSRQPRRKHRQDVREVAWSLETSSTGTRSRSVTPDSLDSGDNPISHDSDEDHHLSSLPPFPSENSHQVTTKTKVKWTSSEPLQNKKFTRHDNKGDIAHLGSNNVVLKGYQPLTENGIPVHRLRERSGSDPSPEIYIQSLNVQNLDLFTTDTSSNLHTPLGRTTSNISNGINNSSTVHVHGNELNGDESLSFEGLIKQNEGTKCETQAWQLKDGVNVDELTDSEYQYLKPLIYVEVIAIFDQYKIRYYKKKASSKSKGGNVFGVNLSTLVMRDMPTPSDNSMVPKVFQIIINELNSRCLSEDGILRLAGQKQKLEVLCAEVESKFYGSKEYIEDLLTHSTTHELTGILKKLLRELPDPIITMELFDMFHKAGSIPDLEEKVKALNLLVLMLPHEHRNTFRVLVQLLLNIINHEHENRMGLHNVAMITAPSFFPPKLLVPMDSRKLIDKMTKEDLTKQINEAAVCCRIMEMILKTGMKLWTVPTYLASQAREAKKKAQVKKDMAKDVERKIRSSKTTLVRSSTQYEPGPMNVPRMKPDFLV